MVLSISVSAFPEPLRQPSADSDSESSKLRAFFAKKPDSRLSTRPNTEEFILPSTSSSSSRSSQATPGDEHDAYAHMVLSSQHPLPLIPQRPRKVSIPRKAPQIKKQSSLGRLEIGARSRSTSGSLTMNALFKPPTPVQDLSTKTTELTSSLRRPLPAVPNSTSNPTSTVESIKSSPPRPAGVSQKPPSSVLLSKPSRPRSHTTSPPAVSVRYQPLVVDVNTKASQISSSRATSPSGQIRRLPAIPVSAANSSLPAPLPRHAPRPTRPRRQSSSPGQCNSFNPTGRRSPFDAIPSSWASRPVDLNPTQQARSPSRVASSSNSRSSSPTRALPSNQVAPRARSHSRPNRDPSEGAHHSGSRTLISASPRHTRMLSPASLASTSSSSTSRTSIRTSSTITPSTSPTSSPVLPLSSPKANRFIQASSHPVVPHSKIVQEATVADSSSSIGAPLHRHPTERINYGESTLDLNSSEEVPSEVYIDDEDYSSAMSRSPSPMRYARPNSRGSLSSLSDDSSDYSRSRSRAVRDQLRSYRRSYRAPKNPSRSPSPIQYARRKSLEGLDEIATPLSPKRREQPRSYQFDYKAAQESSPFLMAPSPSRKSSDNVSKQTNSSNSTSIKTRRGRSKGSRHSRTSRSRSPRWPRFGTPTGSVIDISLPSTQEQPTPDRTSSEHKKASRSVSYIDPRRSVQAKASGSSSSWSTTAGGSWEEVSNLGKKQWIDVYNDDNAVMVTTIQPTKDVWKEEEMKRIFRS